MSDASPHAQNSPLLEVKNLSTSFRTEHGVVHAVDDVSFVLERGKTLGVVGESGSGKTVLSRSVMGLLPKRNVIREGHVLYEGTDVIGYDEKQMSHVWGAEMAMVFQDPMTSLNPVMKIGKQITESLRHHLGVDKDEATATATALLRQVGIPEPERRLSEYPHQLSGGMRQRVTIAIALACGPKILFADEPTTALDVTVQAQILDLLDDLQRDRHMAMILVSHDLGVVASRTDEIMVMYGGKVVEQAATSELFR
ncbi:MAG: ATP-binding cassette domain-containing protein, partial [Actinobacteria bacterium]|nr:ATP-binding cassette domain-containing protein [Actinomycetota bacterium]